MVIDLLKLPVAILYQALPPPLINGVRKAAKPGGYADSGADIGFALKRVGINVITPILVPDEKVDTDWVFPDTKEGIAAALDAGAKIIWGNTVFFPGHPIEEVPVDIWIVGQPPDIQKSIDDKFLTNQFLRESGISIASSMLIGHSEHPQVIPLHQIEPGFLDELGFAFPLVVKPVRGRGSFGVNKVANIAELQSAATDLLSGREVGDVLMLERYLPGEELTVTILPVSSCPERSTVQSPRVLRPVRRLNHQNGVSPYNGNVAVMSNSEAISFDDMFTHEIKKLVSTCAAVMKILGARAPIRIDCRANRDGEYQLFDINAKPNMTGSGRPGRENQDSLSAMAARAEGISYTDFLLLMLQGAWSKRSNS